MPPELKSSQMKHLNTLSSAGERLYCETGKRRGSGWWKWAPAIILGSLFVYRSTRPAMRLRSEPPPSFYDYSRAWSQAKLQHEKRLADAYWQVAVRRIQRQYSPNRPLPLDPPPQFQIGGSANSLNSGVVAGRVHYWFRLRKVWSQRDAWSVSYRWNTNWVESVVSSFPQYIPQWVSNIFQGLIILFNGIGQRISPP